MKRRAFNLLVFLLLGAIVNVAVAWGCAIVMTGWTSSRELVPDEATELREDLFPSACVERSLTWGGVTNNVGRQMFFLVHRAFCGDGNPESRSVFRRQSAGMPLLSFSAEYRREPGSSVAVKIKRRGVLFVGRRSHGDLVHDTALPYAIIWPGFAINTIFYAVVLWMMFAFPFVVRRRRRIKRGLCPACAYPVGTSSVCTECGKPVKQKAETQKAEMA